MGSEVKNSKIRFIDNVAPNGGFTAQELGAGLIFCAKWNFFTSNTLI